MWTVTDTDFELLGEEGVCATFSALISAVAVGNYYVMRRHPGLIPRLYDSPVVFRPEPNAGKYEEIASARRVASRGWGDCDDLVAYRIGEILCDGQKAAAKVYVKFHLKRDGRIYELTWPEAVEAKKNRIGKVLSLYHAQVRKDNGSVEDPARLLGM